MADAPENIWAGSCAALGAPDTGFWYPVRTPSTPTTYIRADLAVLATTHARTLEALREARAEVQALADMAAAEIKDAEASLAKQYYHGKERGLTEALAKIDAALARIDALKDPTP